MRRGDAGWLHILTDRRQESTKNGIDWPRTAAKFAANLVPSRREALAASLGLPPAALDPLPLLGFNPTDRSGGCFTFPEMDAAGAVIGIIRRFQDGTKRAMSGSRRGLTQPIGWRDRPGPLFVAEGPTDAAALTAAGLAAVSRPSNASGAAQLAELFRDLEPYREVLILGENDQKEDGNWPGQSGALSVAQRLSELWRPVRAVMPPPDAKDARAWLTATARGNDPWTDRGAEFCRRITDASSPAGVAGVPASFNLANDGPDNPHRLAAKFLTGPPTGGPLRFWRGDFFRYCGGAYHPLPDNDLWAELTQHARREFIRANENAVMEWAAQGGKKSAAPPRVRPVTSRVIGDTVQALRGLCLLPASTVAPAWIDGASGPDPAALLAVANGVLDFDALAAGRPAPLLSPSPAFFTHTVAPFAFEPSAPPPRAWMGFLNDLWPDDPDSVAALQEWFGYLLTPDTRQQKILFLVGPRRGGKGTIARILRELIGPANVAGPTLGSLATNFGLAPLLGKSVAVVSDARLSGRLDAAPITERLLAISGEDALTIDRKHRDALTVKLNTRFVILSNELPRLGDASGALVGRLVILRMTQSFFGREDSNLFDRLRSELPGVLLWAVEGWCRLRDRGHFLQPPTGARLAEEMEDLSSPVGAFVRERCVVEPHGRIEIRNLYQKWKLWCDEHGRKEPGTEETFGRDLRAAVPSIVRVRPRTEGRRPYWYAGIRLRTVTDAPEDE